MIDAYRSNISGNLTAGKMVNLSGATVSGNVTAKSIDIHETKTMDAQISGSVTATGGGELNLGSHAMRLDGSSAVLTLEKDTQISSNKPAGKTQIDVRNGASLVSWADVLLDFTRAICMDEEIVLNEAVYHSEFDTGDRNRAIGYLLKSKEVLEGDVLKTVDLYFKLCSLSVTARSLAGLGLILANGGVDPRSGIRLLSAQTVRTVKTLMLTCGMYDRSGEFAVRVGLPCKSGVGGGIMSSVENRMGIGTYGPALDEKGNSIGGGYALEYLSHALHLHIFDSESA